MLFVLYFYEYLTSNENDKQSSGVTGFGNFISYSVLHSGGEEGEEEDELNGHLTNESLRPSLTTTISDQSEENVLYITPTMTYLTCVFYFFHSGLYKGFALCIIFYALNSKTLYSDNQATNLMFIYWLSMTVSRLCNIFVFPAIASTKIASQLTLSVLAAVVLI
eukprot:gene28927-35880_t